MARPRNEDGPTRPTRQADREKAEKHSAAELAEIAERRRMALNADTSASGAGREALTVLRALLREELEAAGAGKIKPSTSRTRASQMAAMLAKASEPEKRIEQLTNDLRDFREEFRRLKEQRAARVDRVDPARAGAAPLPQ